MTKIFIKPVKEVQEDLTLKMLTGLLEHGSIGGSTVFQIYLNPHIKTETIRQARPKSCGQHLQQNHMGRYSQESPNTRSGANHQEP